MMEKKVKGNNKAQQKKKTKKAKVRVFQKKNKGDSEQQRIKSLQEQYESIDIASVKNFNDFPLSANTKKGLKENKFTEPTEIQKETIGLCLRGKDVLGAAKTGSGKTLAFLIPVLEILYCKQWTRLDGLGALIITPTRELAYQIFETLRKVGVHHDFSAGLIIGGKDLKFERKRMGQVNIIIGTPGRLLQHMDENPLFDCVNMQVLVLDEADRCLDMGFQASMNAIVANLPPSRQTLLFSATQTKSVKDLARLSLKEPSYVSVHEHSKYSTPENLKQSYAVCELHEKISVVWSFIRNHLKKKIIIFYSSCKEVKYIYEIFCRLRPGVSLLALYGTLHQMRRMAIYDEFCSKSSAVLFATDLASRGLDFPNVDWVVQADCPEDTDTYIHRVGRTARYNSGGASFLVLLPSEEKTMLEKLNERKIPIDNIDVNPTKLQNPVKKMEAFLARDPNLKATAQRAFVSYIKAIFLMKNKDIFNIQSLDTDAFAHSLGLAIPPRIRFLDRYNKQKAENSSKPKKEKSVKPKEPEQNNSLNNKIKFESDDESETESVEEKIKIETNDIKSEPETSDDDEEETNQHQPKFIPKKSAFDVSDDSEEDEGMFTLKRKDHDIEDPLSESEVIEFNRTTKSKKPVTKAALAKKILKKNIVPNTKVVFDDEGEKVFSEKEKRSELAQKYENADVGGIDIETAKLVLREEDKFDRQRFREKVKAKHKEEKRKLKEQKRKEQEQDEFGSESEEEAPDLSWMPDPDKIYGEKTSDEEEFFNAESVKKEEESDEDVSQKQMKKKQKKPLKRKVKPESNEEKPKTKKQKKLQDVSSSLTVNEAEELAMMLLRNK